MSFSFFSPFTTRKSKLVRKRLQTQKRKAYEKHKLVQEQAEGARFKAKSDAIKDSSSLKIDLFEDSRGMFYFGSVRGASSEENESEASPLEELFEKKHFLRRFCEKLRGSTEKWELNLWQFLIIVFSLHLPPAYIIQHITTVNTWGASLVLFVYAIIVVVIAVPIYIVYIFLGNYSRKAYIKVWNCVPLFRGIAYSITAAAMVYELLNVAFTGLSLLYLKDVITAKPPWISCKFPGSHPNCVPMHDDHKPYTTKCSSEDRGNQCLKYGALDYYVNYVLQEGYADVPQKNDLLRKWVITVIILWLLIYILLNVGLQRYRYFLTVLNITILVCLFVPGFLGASFLSPKFSLTSQATSDLKSLFNYNFWIHIAVHTLQKETPGDVITFSSLSKPTVNVIMYAIAIYSAKVLVIITITVWSSIFISSVQKHYKVEESFCIKSRGDHVIFAVIPDVLSRWPAHQLMLPLYFLCFSFWGLSTSTYALSSFLEALFEEFPEFSKCRFVLTTLLCASLGTANVFLLRPNFMGVFSYVILTLFIYVKTAQLLIIMVALFIYSLDRLKNDYHFNCGFKMENCLIQGLKVAFLFLSFLLLMCVLKVGELTLQDVSFILGLLSPVFLGMLIITFRYTLKLSPTLLDPDPSWGPSGRQRMLARNRFDAAEDLHFRATRQICDHKCLISSIALKKEIKHWQTKQVVRTRQLLDDRESIEKEI